MTDTIEIRDLAFETVIGIRPDERHREQPVAFDLALTLDLSVAGRSGRIGDTVDYDRVARSVEALIRFRRFRLIEAAVEETAAMLLGVHRGVKQVSVRLRKPEAIGKAEAASVHITRKPADFPRRFETTKWGQAEILLETREAGLYLLHVDPGLDIPRHHHEVMRELEWLVEGELWREHNAVEAFSPVSWKQGEIHSYHNRAERRATLFCCDCPPFIPGDEIEERAAP